MSPTQSRIAEAAFDRLRDLPSLDRIDAIHVLLSTDWADGDDVAASRAAFVEILAGERPKLIPMPMTIPFRGR